MEAIARVLTVGDGRARLACEVRSSCGWALARVTAQRGQPGVSVQRLDRDAEA